MERYGSFHSGPHSWAIFSRRSAMPGFEFPRTRSRRSRMASLTATVMLSPVRLASSRAWRWTFSFFMFKLIVPPIYHFTLPFYHHGSPKKIPNFDKLRAGFLTKDARNGALLPAGYL